VWAGHADADASLTSRSLGGKVILRIHFFFKEKSFKRGFWGACIDVLARVLPLFVIFLWNIAFAVYLYVLIVGTFYASDPVNSRTFLRVEIDVLLL
jgi:hypothetical protein